ncbi:MAG TPA: HDOD domain-containing protein [Burkholderiales bacterium]
MDVISLDPQVSHEALMMTTQNLAVIGRQAIVDAKRNVIGYELLQRGSAAAESSNIEHSSDSDAAMLFSALSNIGAEALFGTKLAFVNVTLDTIKGEHLELVHPARIVLEVAPVPGNDAEQISTLSDDISRLKARGFRIAFGQFALTRPYVSWLALADYVKIDMRALKHEVLPTVMKIATAQPKLKLIAEKVETPEEFALMEGLGANYFQGFLFAKPSAVTARVASPAYANVLQLISLVGQEADASEIEKVLKRDPTLSFKLLRYINSAGFGLGCEVTSFRHAVMILGLNKLFRWSTLLLTSVKSSTAPPAVANLAITRGRFMELLAAEFLSKEDCDHAFVVGVFSLLDVMLGIPMQQALENLVLPQDVVATLLDHEGILAPFLDLVEACERCDAEEISTMARSLQLTNDQINRAHLQALAWAENLMD